MRNFYRFLIQVIIAVLLFSPSLVYAQITPTVGINPDTIETEIGDVPTTVPGFVAKYYQFGLGIIGGLAVLFIITGSYIILTSQGNPQQLNNGKSFITYAIAGLLLAIFGYLFIEVVARDLLHIPGFE